MAKYFKKLSKIDLYTINQVKFFPINDVNDLVFVRDSKMLNGLTCIYQIICISDNIVIGANDLDRSHSLSNANSIQSGKSAFFTKNKTKGNQPLL
ncbi:hypothetical protein AAW12_22910 [Sphingobacterium sp. Ag1]|nr:hypothetical protein AAW12_22910 [Sphingobacterium sp. Ag1]